MINHTEEEVSARTVNVTVSRLHSAFFLHSLLFSKESVWIISFFLIALSFLSACHHFLESYFLDQLAGLSSYTGTLLTAYTPTRNVWLYHPLSCHSYSLIIGIIRLAGFGRMDPYMRTDHSFGLKQAPDEGDTSCSTEASC